MQRTLQNLKSIKTYLNKYLISNKFLFYLFIFSNIMLECILHRIQVYHNGFKMVNDTGGIYPERIKGMMKIIQSMF